MKSLTDWTREIRGRSFSNATSIIRFIFKTKRSFRINFEIETCATVLTGHFIPGSSALGWYMGHKKTRPSTAMASTYFLVLVQASDQCSLPHTPDTCDYIRTCRRVLILKPGESTQLQKWRILVKYKGDAIPGQQLASVLMSAKGALISFV